MYLSHSFVKYIKQKEIIIVLIISDGILTMWIMLNPLDIRIFMILIFADIQFKDNSLIISTQKLKQVNAIMNLVTIAQFFKAIYIIK